MAYLRRILPNTAHTGTRYHCTVACFFCCCCWSFCPQNISFGSEGSHLDRALLKKDVIEACTRSALHDILTSRCWRLRVYISYQLSTSIYLFFWKKKASVILLCCVLLESSCTNARYHLPGSIYGFLESGPLLLFCCVCPCLIRWQIFFYVKIIYY